MNSTASAGPDLEMRTCWETRTSERDADRPAANDEGFHGPALRSSAKAHP
jgi:hypothetical protein